MEDTSDSIPVLREKLDDLHKEQEDILPYLGFFNGVSRRIGKFMDEHSGEEHGPNRKHVDAQVSKIMEEAAPDFREVWAKREWILIPSMMIMDPGELVLSFPSNDKLDGLSKEWSQLREFVEQHDVKGPAADMTKISFENACRLHLSEKIKEESKEIKNKISEARKQPSASHLYASEGEAESNGESPAEKL